MMPTKYQTGKCRTGKCQTGQGNSVQHEAFFTRTTPKLAWTQFAQTRSARGNPPLPKLSFGQRQTMDAAGLSEQVIATSIDHA